MARFCVNIVVRQRPLTEKKTKNNNLSIVLLTLLSEEASRAVCNIVTSVFDVEKIKNVTTSQ